MNDASAVTASILCHCLQVREAEVDAAIEFYGCQSLNEVIERTGAGGGCTCCHRRIWELLATRRRLPAERLPAVA